MKIPSAHVVCLALLVLAPASGWAGNHSHQGGPQEQKQKKDPPPHEDGAAESFDPAAVNEALTPTATGGIRRVVANESSDAKQIGLIRAKLKALADNFGPDALAGPVGAKAPAAAALEALQSAAPGRLRAQFLEIRAGGEIRYSADDPALAAALRNWLGTQVADPSAPAPVGHAN